MRSKAMVALLPLLGACMHYDASRLPPGTPAAQVRATYGAPTAVRPAAGGGEVWEYARGPEGLQTYMVRVGPDRRVRGVSQVLTVQNFAQVRPGVTTRDEVAQVLGTPTRQSVLPLKRQSLWEYRYDRNGEEWVFYVAFDASGVVTETGTVNDDPRWRSSGGGAEGS